MLGRCVVNYSDTRTEKFRILRGCVVHYFGSEKEEVTILKVYGVIL